MPEYLVAIHHPDGYDGSLEGEEMMRDDALRFINRNSDRKSL